MVFFTCGLKLMALLQHLRIALQVSKQKFKFKWPSPSKKRSSLLNILDKKRRKSSHLLQFFFCIVTSKVRLWEVNCHLLDVDIWYYSDLNIHLISLSFKSKFKYTQTITILLARQFWPLLLRSPCTPCNQDAIPRSQENQEDGWWSKKGCVVQASIWVWQSVSLKKEVTQHWKRLSIQCLCQCPCGCWFFSSRFTQELRLVDVGAGRRFQCKPRRNVAPTLTKTRASQGGFWLTKLERPLSPTESWQKITNSSFWFEMHLWRSLVEMHHTHLFFMCDCCCNWGMPEVARAPCGDLCCGERKWFIKSNDNGCMWQCLAGCCRDENSSSNNASYGMVILADMGRKKCEKLPKSPFVFCW